MRSLRVPLADLSAGRRSLDRAAGHYVSRVHRMAEGDRFVAFDPERVIEADVRILAVEANAVQVEVGEIRPGSLRPTRPIVLAQGVGKADKLDAVVRDATELGVSHIAPVLSERSVAKSASPAADLRRRRIGLEAARQCGRGDMPRIDPPASLEAVLTDVIAPLVRSGGLAVALTPGGEVALKAVLAELQEGRAVAFLIGPEGGLTEAELCRCASEGLVRARIGKLVLRTETVAAAALGALLVVSE